MTENENDVAIREVQTATLSQHESQSLSSFRASITPAIRAAGLESGGSFRFMPNESDELGMLPALGSEESVDGRRKPLARNIRREGVNQGTLRLVIPREALEAILGFSDVHVIDPDNPPELAVWAGDRMLAFELAERSSVTVDREQNGGVDD
jgi:hypothetical protein